MHQLKVITASTRPGRKGPAITDCVLTMLEDQSTFGVAEGARAVQMLKQVVTTQKMMPIFEAVHIPFLQNTLMKTGFLKARTF